MRLIEAGGGQRKLEVSLTLCGGEDCRNTSEFVVKKQQISKKKKRPGLDYEKLKVCVDTLTGALS